MSSLSIRRVNKTYLSRWAWRIEGVFHRLNEFSFKIGHVFSANRAKPPVCFKGCLGETNALGNEFSWQRAGSRSRDNGYVQVLTSNSKSVGYKPSEVETDLQDWKRESVCPPV